MSAQTQIYVAVMGVTGSGKSSFIKCCVEKNDIDIGHDLKSCEFNNSITSTWLKLTYLNIFIGTKDVMMHSFNHSPSVRVNLIDTPGFDDGNDLSDADILKKISDWLANLYRGGVKLNGLLYLHRIIDVRLQGSARKNLTVFQKVCGNDALKNVTLVSTMWDTINRDSQDLAKKREKQLLDDDEFWGEMVREHGTQVGRHYNTRESAMKLLKRFIDSPDTRVVVDLQQEVIDGKTLEETAAGLEVLSEINKAKALVEEKLRAIEKQMEENALEMKQLAEARAKAEREALNAERKALAAERKKEKERMRRLKEQGEKMYADRKLREAQAAMARVAELKKEKLEAKLGKSYWRSFASVIAGGTASALAIAAAPATGGISLAAVPKICALVGVSLGAGKVSRDNARRKAREDGCLDYTTSMYHDASIEALDDDSDDASEDTPEVQEIEYMDWKDCE